MQKDNVSRISVQMLDGERFGVPCVEGKANELLAMASGVIHATLIETPKNRKYFRRAAWKILRETRPEWLNTAAVYTLGVGVIFGAVYLVGNGLVIVARALGMW